MAVIATTSSVVREELRMSNKTADEEIVVENIHGQTVVVVPKGHPVPEDLEEAKRRAAGGVIRTASTDEVDQSRPAGRRKTTAKTRTRKA